MSELVRAKPHDVEKRWEARLWLTEAIQRAIRDGIPVGPAMALLQALESLDIIEIVEVTSSGEERIQSTVATGPAVTKAHAPNTHLRIAGKTEPILALPSPTDELLPAKKGQAKRTPAELGMMAFKIAAVERLIDLETPAGTATAMVEDELGPVENARKRMKSGRDPLLNAEFEKAKREFTEAAKEQVLLKVFLARRQFEDK